MKKEFYNVAEYYRLSSEDGDKEESDSIGNQRKLVKNYIKSRHYLLSKKEYVDDGYSGTNFNRPGFKAMIADIENKNIDCVIVKDLSRFGRNYIDAGFYLERFFVDKNVRFIAINDNIDSFEKEYDMLMPVKNIFNAQYALDISRKVQSSFKVKQKSGEFIGAFASYGYKKSPTDKHTLIIDEYASSIVKRIFDLYLSGIGKIGIAGILNKEGILCPSAYKEAQGQNYKNCNRLDQTKYWTYSTINSILKNEIYIGNMVQGKSKRRMNGKPQALNEDEWIKVENTHPPIIDQDVWDKTQVLLKKKTKMPYLNENVSIFAGLLKCGDCGRAMTKKYGSYGQSKSSKRIYYVCGSYVRYGLRICTSHTLRHEDLENTIKRDLNCIIKSINDIMTLVYTADKESENKDPKEIWEKEISLLNIELKKILKIKSDLYADFKEELISKEEYLQYRIIYTQKEELISDKIKNIQKNIDKSQNSDSIFDVPWVKRLLEYGEIKELDRETVIELIDTIYVYTDRIKIVYNFSDDLDVLFNRTFNE